MKVAVIGGGPGGLVTLKYLTTAHKFFPIELIEVRLFDSGSSIGGTFRQRAYEDAEQVSSKQLTTFSDFRVSDNEPDFLPIKTYVSYLEQYCSHFNLWPHIQLSKTVTSVRRHKIGGHIVAVASQDGNTEQWDCDAVAVCSGLHVSPNIPAINGIENVPIVIHSSQFKERKQFGVGSNVVVLGTGETGMDIAHLAVTSPTNSVTMCHRDGFLCAAKRAPNPVILGFIRPQGPSIPTDVLTASLFESMYVHPVMRDSLIPWAYYDAFVKYSLWLVSGTTYGIDQWIGGLPDKTYHTSQLFFTKSSLAMPYISAPYRSNSLIHRIRSKLIQVPLPDTKGKVIDLAPWPQSIDVEGKIHFMENGRPEAERMRNKTVRPDILILATGYTQKFPFLDATYPRPEDADIRRIWKSDDETVGFIGFVRPSFCGAIPPLAEFQSQLWVLSLLNRLPHPLEPVPESRYALLMPPDRRIQYGVDHEAYAYQLALDMESAPSFSQMVQRGPKLLATWALGANFNTKFRLIGPWRWDGAEYVMRGELWGTVTRRGGLFGIVVLSVIPMLIFGTLNAAVWAFCEVVGCGVCL